jgi:NAD(P)-dependent dehydrogenase (short-subunit alcohol dehydrogenase family)
MTESFNFHVDTNLRGVFYCMKHEIRQMLKNGGGAIVNQSSITVAISLSSTVSGLRGRFTV